MFVQRPEIKAQSAAKIMDLDIIDELEGDLSKKLYLLLTALAENGLLRYNKSRKVLIYKAFEPIRTGRSVIAAMERLIDLDLLQDRSVLPILLHDKTTGQNIIWATDTYEAYGDGYSAKEPITSALVTGKNSSIIQPRIAKAISDQADRTKKHAEVFTPAWICNMMVNHCDEVWFGRKNVFNTSEDKHWTPSEAPIEFPRKKRWQRYVDSRRLEITCGEAPYLVSRYDASTGELIPVTHRIGILDRKLRVVNENAENEVEWLKYAFRALESVYGFEYQGDNLLIARVNVLVTFMDAVQERLQRKPTDPEIKRAAEIISRNIWQMDGLKGTVPFGSLQEANTQLSIWDLLSEIIPAPEENKRPECQIYDWRGQGKLKYNDRKTRKGKEMKFDFVIGNPPYQETTDSDSTRMPPVYDKFMDAAYTIGDNVELITPARFLFDAGQTQKSWNKKMLEDPHLTVLYFNQDAAQIFPNTDIKGGIAITYRNAKAEIGPIGAFVPWKELRSVLKKVGAKTVESSLTDIADSSNVYDLKNIYTDHPDYQQYIADNGRHAQLKTNVLNINPIFTDNPTEPDDYKVCGLVAGKRGAKYCHRKYIKSVHKSLFKWKTLVPKAAGSGRFGDALPPILVVGPAVAFTQTYISIGTFDSKEEAANLSKYLRTKLCRALLYVLKVTQDNLPAVWRCIPKQDFTPSSDIDWSVSVAEIDRQLYKKYNLSEEEIAFIETHVKEMA